MYLHGWKLYVILAWMTLTSLFTGYSLLHAQGRVEEIHKTLTSEKVCSASNVGPACQALFDRLAASITDAQRTRLACVVFQYAEVKPNIPCPVIPSNEGKP